MMHVGFLMYFFFPAGKRTRSKEEMESDISRINSRLDRMDCMFDRLERFLANQSEGNISTATVTQDPSDYGCWIRSLCPPADGSILPKPVTSSVANSILPPYDGDTRGNRILEVNFKEWMTKINADRCKNYDSFQGGTHRAGRHTKKVDFHM